jgi:hypothetical protein
MRHYKSVICLIVIAFAVLSCTTEHEEMLIGTWRFSDVQEQITNGDPPMPQTDIDIMKQQSSYTFNKNKTYMLDLGQQKDNGMWYVSENGAALNMRSEKSNAVGRATIRELKKDKLVLVIQLTTGHIQILSMYKI